MSRASDESPRIALALARALRDEFGVETDAHPGGDGIEAGTVNRAFLAALKAILAHCVAGGGDLTPVLRQAALGRLKELGVCPDLAASLVSSEAQLGDRWLAYLALAPTSVIDD